LITRIIGKILVGSTGFRIPKQWAAGILLARKYKVVKLEAVAIGEGEVCLTIYGRPVDLSKGEKIKPWHLKIFHLTREHLVRTELHSEKDERDQFFQKHDVRPEHIASAALDGGMVAFCLYFDLPKD